MIYNVIRAIFRCIAAVFLTLMVCLPCSWAQESSVSKPVLIFRPAPTDLPRALQKSIATGVVIIRAQISDRGQVETLEFIKRSGIDSLDSYLKEWVARWEYLPRTMSNRSISTYTVITIRYDMSTGSFDAPQPINEPVEIPDVAVPQRKDATAPSEGPKPSKRLDIITIPPHIQALKASGTANFFLETDSRGVVQKISSDTPGSDPEFIIWIYEYLEKVSWTFERKVAEGEHQFIKLPISYNTETCKIVFGAPQHVDFPSVPSN